MLLASKKSRGFRKRSFLLLGCALAFGASCSSEETKPRGQLMLAITTDLSIDKDMNQVHVEVTDQNGLVVDSSDRDIIPTGEDALPGTLALVPPNSGGQIVHIVVTAKQNGKLVPRVVREAIAKVPTDRIAMLRMPLHFLCSDLPEDCGKDFTCKAGRCEPAEVDSDALPDYAEGLVFGGGDSHGNGSYCLDAQACFEQTEVLAPNMTDCSVPLPKGADPAKLNVALVLPPMTDGHCIPDDSGTPQAGNCLMPLDDDPVEGFAISGNKIRLPPAACERPSLVGVSVSTSCRTKDLSVPICGPWTGWAAQPGPDAGSAGAAGSGEVAMGGSGASPSSGGTGGTSSAGEGGEAGEAGANCPVTAALAPAYYYVLIDTSSDMGPALATIRQALVQFAGEAASAGTQFGLQVAAPVCHGNYATPVLGFEALPISSDQFPNLQPGNQPRLQLDSAMVQTVDTLQAVSSPASRTLVVFTSAVDQGCGSLVDIMHQALSDALGSGVSMRPVLVVGTDNPSLQSGLSTQGSPQVVQMTAANIQLQAVLTQLNTFRDVLGPCTFIAPDAAKYFVTIATPNVDNPDSPKQTNVPLVASAANCGNAIGYYKGDQTFTLCPSACSAKGTSSTVVTDACATSAPVSTGSGGAANGSAGASGIAGTGTAAVCPADKPTNGAVCNSEGLSCAFAGTPCICQKGTWTCLPTP